MSDRVIDPEALKATFWAEVAKNPGKVGITYEAVEALIDSAPSVEAEPIIHGRWVKVGNPKWSAKLVCSVCNTQGYSASPRCRKCGAHMDPAERKKQ